MQLKPRPNTFTYARLILAMLLVAGSVLCFTLAGSVPPGAWLLKVFDTMGGRNVLRALSALAGLASLVSGTMLLLLIADRRDKKRDRRQRQVRIDFPDRRSGLDRRDLKAAAKVGQS